MANFNYSRQSGSYDVDICLVIDKTGSMRPIIDTVKNNALRLYDDIKENMSAKGKTINNMRVRVMFFGDYIADGAEAFYGCDFLDMPDNAEVLKQCVESARAIGGGDNPEDGLEALAFGIRSKWCNDSNKKRHIICLFTDDNAHDLGYGSSVEGYPQNAPKTYEELLCMWGTAQFPGEMDPFAKRLLLFAPKMGYWERIAKEWENTVMLPVSTANGLRDVTYQSVLDTVGNSI